MTVNISMRSLLIYSKWHAGLTIVVAFGRFGAILQGADSYFVYNVPISSWKVPTVHIQKVQIRK